MLYDIVSKQTAPIHLSKPKNQTIGTTAKQEMRADNKKTTGSKIQKHLHSTMEKFRNLEQTHTNQANKVDV